MNDCLHRTALNCPRVGVEKKCTSPRLTQFRTRPRRTSVFMLVLRAVMNCGLLFGAPRNVRRRRCLAAFRRLGPSKSKSPADFVRFDLNQDELIWDCAILFFLAGLEHPRPKSGYSVRPALDGAFSRITPTAHRSVATRQSRRFPNADGFAIWLAACPPRPRLWTHRIRLLSGYFWDIVRPSQPIAAFRRPGLPRTLAPPLL